MHRDRPRSGDPQDRPTGLPVRDRQLSILIVGTGFDFPHGGGASSRVFWYAKGLAEAGDTVRVVSLALPSRDKRREAVASGTYQGLRYEYACGSVVRPEAFWRRRWLELRRAVRTVDLVRDTVADSGDCVVLIYSEVTSWIVGLALLARAAGAGSVLDLCEFPLVWRRPGLWTSFHRAARMKLVCRLVDGVIPISTYLESYVRQCSRRTPAMLRVPVMIDPGLFPGEVARFPRRVLYCGTLFHLNETEQAIRVFARAAADMRDVRLSLVGGGPQHLRARAELIARSVGLTDRVEFVDRLTRDELAARLAAADVLILPRADGVFSRAGLPNKLGEYLASGRPVVTTGTGDIPLYLRDGMDAYLVPPGDDAAFSDRLRQALTHSEEASQVGARGRAVATAQFDYRSHGVRLHEFLEECVRAGQRSVRSGTGSTAAGVG
jgi:glycosyltransferase involved in cell wall biosynthesis